MAEMVTIGDCTLYRGDAFVLLPTFTPESVDHMITDPPYAEKTHAGARTGRRDRSLVTFDSIDDDTFLMFCRECVRVARRWVLMTCDWRHSAAAERSSGVPVVRCGVWIKPDAAPQFTGDRPGTGWEAVVILHREGRKKWNGGGHHAVWHHPVERNNVHPTQKPLALVRRWLEQFTDRGDLILDPFMGSGTTGVACLQTGRRFIGIEIDPTYFDIACRRLRECNGDTGLYAGASKPAELFGEESTA